MIAAASSTAADVGYSTKLVMQITWKHRTRGHVLYSPLVRLGTWHEVHPFAWTKLEGQYEDASYCGMKVLAWRFGHSSYKVVMCTSFILISTITTSGAGEPIPLELKRVSNEFCGRRRCGVDHLSRDSKGLASRVVHEAEQARPSTTLNLFCGAVRTISRKEYINLD